MATLVQPVAHVERFAAMGTRAEVHVVDGPARTIELVRTRLAWLEARWSRFRPGSDVSELNREAGRWVPVAPETLLLLDRAVAAAAATDGRYDPTVGAALAAHGYDRTFEEVAEHARSLVPRPSIDAAWPMIETDHRAGTARLPEGTSFDPGGIGKGLAADLAASELSDQAAGLLVNLGGDLRAIGQGPTEDGWVISIEDPFHPDVELARLAIAEGAVASSTRTRRTWETATGAVHHLIDPRTGTSARTGVAAVTVVAAEAWWAEAQATSMFLLGPRSATTASADVEVLIVADDGTQTWSPGLDGVLR
jgi:thiamine biosynthesis lipoprotein